MSRCKACDVILNEYELKRIDHQTGQHLDLCNECAAHSNDAVLEEVNKVFDSLSNEELDRLVNA
jgi:protein-arginine kinase activator protein McsA